MVADPGTSARPHCDYCGAVIGVYEPIIVVAADGTTAATSLANTPGVADQGRLLHAVCHLAST